MPLSTPKLRREKSSTRARLLALLAVTAAGCAVLLHALSATDAQGLREADPGEKRFDQRRLPDPWLPRHEDELALAVQRPSQQLVKPRELDVPPDQRWNRW